MDSGSELGDTLNDVTPDLFLTESVENWRETYACPSSRLTAKNLRKVKEELTKGDLLSPQGFCQILGAQRDGGVNYEIYSHIKEIVTKSQSALRKLSAEYESAPMSDRPSYVTFSDGGVFLAASKEERAADCIAEENDHGLKIYDSILAGEFKKKDNPKAFCDNIKKVIGAATSILYNDPCRRHVYAMTLEGKQLRMWYFCRSHIAISLPFNIHKAQDDFLLFLLFLVSATKEELGFDPTVVRVIRRTGTVFRYKVGDVHYETVGDPLNQDAAFHICSRSTRVWKVQKVVRDGAGWREDERDTELHVLRDVWLYHGSTMEKDIQDQIFGKFDEGTREKVRPHFLTILHDVEVTFTTNGVEGRDITPLAPGLSFAVLDPVTENRISKGSRVSKAPLDQGAYRLPFRPSREVPKARIHVRTVFKECCEPVYGIADMITVAKCIDGAIVGLDYLRQAGFVHRDISGGNILWYAPERSEGTTAEVEATGIGKIADLEYCRPYEDSKPSEPITGTPYFLPTEYSTDTYQFFPFENDAPAQKVSFNFYHDLESLIWVYVWFLFNHVPTTPLVAHKGDKEAAKSVQDSVPTSLLADKGFQKAAKSLQASASRWFAFANDAARIYMIKGGCHEEWRELMELYAMTGTSPAPFLEEVRPVVIRQSFVSAQRELQKQEPDKRTRRWPREFFKDTPYTGFRRYIVKHFNSLASLPVTSLSEIIKPEPEGGILRKGSPVPDLPPILDVENEGHEGDHSAAE
ncbi:hypothetical protein BDN71DRAFT_1586966 [Pleurotus eryngii]|uniref:Fungal-type protein kinase domain-containing protein n=1 Tax=Pleurotus eryngii TaxID=5323 RepID=A0A9P6A8U4_PLEER|nr:hypothetical protein BDN71DRAFT_1586966 [Pleurotus eryngii]